MKWRSAIYFLSTLILLAGCILAAGCSPRSPEPPLKVIVATDPSYPPFEQVDAGRASYSGFDMEVMKAIAEKSNLDVTYASIRYQHIIDEIANCNYDAAIAAITVKDEDKKRVLFTDPYLTAGQVVIVKKENVDISDRNKLAGKTVGAQQATVSEQEGKKIDGARVKPYRSLLLVLDDLDNGMIDAAVADKPSVLYYLSQEYYGLKTAGDEWAKEDYALAVCNKKPDLVKRINDALFWMKLDGTTDKITKKWLPKQN